MMNSSSGKLVLYLVGIAAVVVIMFGVQALSAVLNPVLLAVVITITVLPLPGYLVSKGWKRSLAMAAAILLVVFVLLLVIGTVFFSVTKLSTELPALLAQPSVETSGTTPPDPFASTTINISEATAQLGPLAEGAISATLTIVTQFVLALAIFFFMIAAAMNLDKKTRKEIDPNAPVVGRISQLTGGVQHYMTILTGINFLVALGNTIFLSLLGVDYALLWGLLSWFMGYIPSIGFWVALIPPVLMAYAQYGIRTAVIVFIGYVVINGGVEILLKPRVAGKGLKISPLVIFVGLFFWGFLLGGIGAILSVPLTLLVITIMEQFPATRPISTLLRDTGEDEKEERTQAMGQVKDLWAKTKATFTSPWNPEAKDRKRG
jgi:predicted PurR-regulated permease PerM